jgi:tRNA A-37 threonylcarbamoyl transferase component Bud32
MSTPDLTATFRTAHPIHDRPVVAAGRRRRRPTGAPPPLPKHIGASGKAWLLVLALLIAWLVLTLAWQPAYRLSDRVDTAVLRLFAHLRASWLTPVVELVDRAGRGWSRTFVSLALVVLLLVFRRWRHLFTFLGSLAVLEVVGAGLYETYQRPRPYGVAIIGQWAGYSLPSPPVAIFAALLVGILYTMVVPGRPRTIGKGVVAVVLPIFVGARLYLAVDHPLDALVGVALGISIPLAAFRAFTPNTPFPVTYRRAKTAHLDVGGARGEAIRCAVEEQLGLTVLDVGYVGLAGSGGSTPLRLRVAGNGEEILFGKLYAMSHVRSDRWYKLGRTILYGRLEDEKPYRSVRRLAEHEDYTLRLLRDVGVATSTPYGIVEITPSREYLLVTSFIDGAREIGDPEVDLDDDIIEQGLVMMRRLWDAGLAHRDIKPANLLVKDGRLLLIDPAFAQIRPSPWRQAVDLANMMLVLAVRSDATRVYERALQHFSPEEIGEAFAAVRGIASPTQLRAVLKRDGRDLVAQFRALARPSAGTSAPGSSTG